MQKKASLLLAVPVLLGLIGCNVTFFPEESPLIGTWDLEKQITTYESGECDTTTASALFSNRYVFSDDNSFTSSTTIFGIPVNLSGTWSTADGSVTLTTGGESQTWAYSVSGSQLTMTQSSNENSGMKTTSEIYEKQ